MSSKANRNIFMAYLDSLGVRHTRKFSRRLYEEHPHKNNMFGLSKMLADYQIPNQGAMLENPEEITLIEPPFIAQFSSFLVLVEKITEKETHILDSSLDLKIPNEKFREGCSGAILVAEPDESSAEPNYRANRREEWFRLLLKSALIAVAFIAVVFAVVRSELYLNPGLSVLLVINLAGIYISYLLIAKQLHFNSNAADKICSLFGKSDCNDILQSPAAKFIGLIGWSEVGLGYFTSNALIVLFFPELLPYLALVNIVALPYTVWSVWYQKFRAKQWCPLCLVVQLLLWLVFVTDLLAGFITMPSFGLADILLAGCIYVVPFSIAALLLPLVGTALQSSSIKQEMNGIKMKDEVYEALMAGQPHYEVSKDTSRILFGNRDADMLITVMTNPHCNPCAKMHQRIDKILEEFGDKVCVQYIFSSFSEELDDSNRLLISAYLKGRNVDKMYADWFERGKIQKELFKKKYGLVCDLPETTAEFEKHAAWKEKNKLQKTPTILVNGYELADSYKIEDLKYFIE